MPNHKSINLDLRAYKRRRYLLSFPAWKSTKNLATILFPLCLIIFSCAPVTKEVKLDPSLPPLCIIERVPHIRQGKNKCGPASMAMVLNYWGVTITQEELSEEMNWSIEKGTSPEEMSHFPSTLGFRVDEYSGGLFGEYGTIEKLIDNIAKGRPVIVRQWLDSYYKSKDIMSHYRVVVGYDYPNKIIYIKDPASRLDIWRIDFKRFLDLWDLSNYFKNPAVNWMLVIYKETM